MIGYSRKMSAERALNVSYISILVQFVENLDFTATEGDKQENLILKCWPNGPHPDQPVCSCSDISVSTWNTTFLHNNHEQF
jgi:hypothetical protein